MTDSLLPSLPNARPTLRRLLTYSLSENGPFLFIIFVYVLGWDLWQLAHAGTPNTSFISKRFSIVSVGFVGAGYLVRLLYLLTREIPEQPLERLFQIVRDDLPSLFLGLPIVLLIPAFFGVFGEIKLSMHFLIPVYADPYLAAADRALFGMDAWKAISKFLPSGSITVLLDYTYLAWFPIMYAAILAAAFMGGNPERRFRFFATYFMSWIILGNLVALLGDSVGPCFYEVFYGTQPFRPLFDRLNDVSERVHEVMALEVQEYVIHHYMTGTEVLGEGLSAFPSLHVAIAMLVALFLYDFNKIAGFLGVAFLSLILIGSVMLGWHYAVDGLASVVAVPLLWALAGRQYRFLYRDRVPVLVGLVNKPSA
jgi:membrane-associated phospholipid phosphatase